jgi:hypothetical protein
VAGDVVAGGVDGAGGGAAEWVSVGVAVGVGDVEGLGAADATLCVGDDLGGDVEVAALPHPAASMATSASVATFREVTVGKRSITLLRTTKTLAASSACPSTAGRHGHDR